METLLTTEDLSRMLKVSKVWIYKLVRQNKVPFYHIEKCVRFNPEEIKRWLEGKQNVNWHRDKA